jgi:RNA ligase (TIGR02306 family)
MSTLKVEVVAVDVQPHPNADRLDVIQIHGRGWRCVSARGQFQSGDLAVYFPVESVLPETLVRSLGIEKMYSKRLRSIRLRGQVSQGLVAPLSVLPAGTYPGPRGQERVPAVGHEFTELLGVTRYEVPIPVNMQGVQLPDDPAFPRYTEIENFKSFPDVFESQEWVQVSEKLHGTNGRAAKVNGKLLVGSHRLNLVDSEGNLYWRAARAINAAEKLQDGEQVFFEVYGHKIQDLTYGKKPGEIAVGIFDVMKDSRYLDFLEFKAFLDSRGWSDLSVPLLATAQWTPDLANMAEGNSVLDPTQIREGIVVKPLTERYSEQLQGRCCIKAISDEYLCRKDKKDDDGFPSH